MKLVYTMLFFLTISGLNSQEVRRPLALLDSIPKKDYYCIAESKRALQDIKNGQFVFCIMPFYSRHFTETSYVQELNKACEQNQLKLSVFSLPKAMIVGSNPFCYCHTMDAQIQKKMGVGIKEKVIHEADSLFHLKHMDDTFSSYFCDFGIWVNKTDHFESDTLFTDILSLTPYPHYKDTLWPSMTLRIFIDKKHKAYRWDMQLFIFLNKENLMLREQLLTLAITEAKRREWQSGMMAGKLVNSYVDVRYYFYPGWKNTND